VQGDDGPDEGRDVDGEHLVVGLDHHGLNEVIRVHVRQEVEDVLELVDDLVVHGEATVHDLRKKQDEGYLLTSNWSDFL